MALKVTRQPPGLPAKELKQEYCLILNLKKMLITLVDQSR